MRYPQHKQVYHATRASRRLPLWPFAVRYGWRAGICVNCREVEIPPPALRTFIFLHSLSISTTCALFVGGKGFHLRSNTHLEAVRGHGCYGLDRLTLFRS